METTSAGPNGLQFRSFTRRVSGWFHRRRLITGFTVSLHRFPGLSVLGVVDERPEFPERVLGKRTRAAWSVTQQNLRTQRAQQPDDSSFLTMGLSFSFSGSMAAGFLKLS
ncbi:hypothetical protein EYF80_058603 [Liparis tanakae]|uniref:Uncharacterized protein n=1 Tax=Liparis tanakae TaxID=230148 RepID=A0A4Z2EQM8_9TELE|nr:hypothetical protein EYF80_058603 [Liparis tanakae]